MKVAVLDKKGNLLAEKESSGDENLGHGGFNILKGTRKKVPEAFKKGSGEGSCLIPTGCITIFL